MSSTGGKIEKDETDHEALTRELREELGVEIEKISEKPILITKKEFKKVFLEVSFYEVELKENSVPRAKEHQKIIWCEKEKLSDLKWIETNLEMIKLLKKRSE